MKSFTFVMGTILAATAFAKLPEELGLQSYGSRAGSNSEIQCQMISAHPEMKFALDALEIAARVNIPLIDEIITDANLILMQASELGVSLSDQKMYRFLYEIFAKNALSPKISEMRSQCLYQDNLKSDLATIQLATEFLIRKCNSVAGRSEDNRKMLNDCRL